MNLVIEVDVLQTDDRHALHYRIRTAATLVALVNWGRLRESGRSTARPTVEAVSQVAVDVDALLARQSGRLGTPLAIHSVRYG